MRFVISNRDLVLVADRNTFSEIEIRANAPRTATTVSPTASGKVREAAKEQQKSDDNCVTLTKLSCSFAKGDTVSPLAPGCISIQPTRFRRSARYGILRYGCWYSRA
jgi:hypothetical protein